MRVLIVSRGWQTLDSTKPAVPPATRCISGCFFFGAAEAAAGAVLDLSSAFDADVDVMVDVQMNRLGSDEQN